MATTVEVHVTGDSKAAAAEVDRAVRRVLQHVRRVQPQLPVPQRPVPYRHSILFREPVYRDGQPYADDDIEDED